MVTNDNVEVALREWVEYNRANGVDRMVIFDNTLGVSASEIRKRDVQKTSDRTAPLRIFDELENDIASGFVQYHHWPVPNCQVRPGRSRKGAFAGLKPSSDSLNHSAADGGNPATWGLPDQDRTVRSTFTRP
eukprot:scaffold2119_cov264-Pinguiococcus_pyrenoidosus.AAC.14